MAIIHSGSIMSAAGCQSKGKPIDKRHGGRLLESESKASLRTLNHSVTGVSEVVLCLSFCLITLSYCPYVVLAQSLQVKWSSQLTSWGSGCTYRDHAVRLYRDSGSAAPAVVSQ